MTITDTHPRQGIARRVRTMLQIRNLTVAKASTRCNIPEPELVSLVHGKIDPSLISLCRLANGLGTTTKWLTSGKRS